MLWTTVTLATTTFSVSAAPWTSQGKSTQALAGDSPQRPAAADPTMRTEVRLTAPRRAAADKVGSAPSS